MIKKILCAVDGTEHSRYAATYAGEMAASLNVPLTMCTVNVLAGGVRGPAVYLFDESRAKEILDEAAKIARQQGAKTVAETELKGREIATAIIQYAEMNGYDQVITGTGDKHGVSRLVLGSVAADIVSRAHCPVTVVK
jgi:nucleotide-binding universal stress UspA family protein